MFFCLFLKRSLHKVNEYSKISKKTPRLHRIGSRKEQYGRNRIEELDFEAILSRRKKTFISLFPENQRADWANTLALESEPVTKLLEESAYMEMLLRARINNGVRASMLAYATGTDLDNIAANFNTHTCGNGK